MVETQHVTEDMIKQFSDPDDPILYQNSIVKLSRYNFKQTRVFCITADFIYIFNGKKINRRHKITNLAAVIMASNNEEFVLHFPNAKDLRVSGLPKDDREEIRTLIQMRFLTKNPTKTLQLYEVPEADLKNYS